MQEDIPTGYRPAKMLSWVLQTVQPTPACGNNYEYTHYKPVNDLTCGIEWYDRLSPPKKAI